jgi:hypothetical protein
MYILKNEMLAKANFIYLYYLWYIFPIHVLFRIIYKIALLYHRIYAIIYNSENKIY